MILADKIIKLRKKNGWSQEQLAEKLEVSRQSVSKWESAQSIPDINKMIKLSQIFGVSTDYLVKDEIEDEKYGLGESLPVDREKAPDDDSRYLSVEEVNQYFVRTKRASAFGGAGSAIALSSLVPFLSFFVKSNIIFLVMGIFMLIIGSIMLYFCYAHSKKYSFLNEESLSLEYGAAGVAENHREKNQLKYQILNVMGIILMMLGIIYPFFPILMTSLFGHENFVAALIGLILTLLSLSLGVALTFYSVSMKNAVKKILEEEQFAPEKKRMTKVTSKINLTFLALILIDLVISLFFWETGLQILIILIILYAIIMSIAYIILNQKK